MIAISSLCSSLVSISVMISHILALSGLLGALYTLTKAIYRVYLSPLSKIPGPKLAAMTPGYEMYYDLIQKARFPWQIKVLHESYGEKPRAINSSFPDLANRSYRANIASRSSHQRPCVCEHALLLGKFAKNEQIRSASKSVRHA